MKNKKMIALIAVIVLLLIGLSIAKSEGPKPVDWSPTFINTKTAPYGTYITYNLLNDIFEKKNIKSTRMPIYNNLKEKLDYGYSDEEQTYDDYSFAPTKEAYTTSEEYADYDEDSIASELIVDSADSRSLEIQTIDDNWFNYIEDLQDTTSYIFINNSFNIEKLELNYLLDFIGLGNNVFISAEEIDYKLLDTLRIKTESRYFKTDTVYTLTDYPERKYPFGNVQKQVRLNTDSCTLPFRVLSQNNQRDTAFLEVQFGKGHIFLHTVPSAFANVNMLQTPKYDFGFRCLSYLPQNSKIIWDEYQKQGSANEDNSLRVMLNNPPLRIALYIILSGLLLFMIFRAKRTQRIIPVIDPPVNSSLEFLDTISNLYYRKNDFNTIVQKRHAYFLDYIRKHYYIPTEVINNEFIEVLSAKSGMEKDKINGLFNLYKDMSTLTFISNDKFLKYNSILEDFYKTVKNK